MRESGGRAPIPSPSSAPATSPESDGDDVAANAAPDVGVGESDGSPTAPSDLPLLGGPPRSRNAVPERRRDVAPPDFPHADLSRTPGGRPQRHVRMRRFRPDRVPADGASPGVVAGEVGTTAQALGATGQGPAGQAAGRPATVEAPPPPPKTAAANEGQPEYDTQTETDAGEVKGLTPAGGTISFWLQPAWDGESREDASFVRLGDDRMRIYKSDHYLRFEITDTEGHPTSLGMPITNWTPNDWHQVATTWDGHVISFFVDGALIGQNAYEGQIDLPRDPKLFVGTNGADQAVAPGRLAGVQVGNQPLTADAVSRRFALSRPAEQR